MKKFTKITATIMSAAILTSSISFATFADEITMQIGSNVTTINGKETAIDSPPIISNERTMLPIRFIAENLGLDVEWNEDSKQITLKKATGISIHYKTDEEIAAENNFNDNKFGLVYDGAITENVESEVNIHPITYNLNGITIAANVYTPAGYNANGSKKYPAVTVAHPNGGVKEQVAGLFAQKLAENGYIAVAADAAYQGASGGEPRIKSIITMPKTVPIFSSKSHKNTVLPKIKIDGYIISLQGYEFPSSYRGGKPFNSSAFR